MINLRSKSPSNRPPPPALAPSPAPFTVPLQITWANRSKKQAVFTFDALDWKEGLGSMFEDVRDQILNNLAPGTIYLMHIGDNYTGVVLDEVLGEILNQGYAIAPLTEAIK